MQMGLCVGTAGTAMWVSEDGGETWTKLQREFGEVRAMILRPLEGKED